MIVGRWVGGIAIGVGKGWGVAWIITQSKADSLSPFSAPAQHLFERVCVQKMWVGVCICSLFSPPLLAKDQLGKWVLFFPPPSFTKRKLMQVLFRRRRGGQKEGKLFVKKEGENRKEVATIFQRPNFLRKAKVFLEKGRTSIPFCPRKELQNFVFVFFTRGKRGKHLFFACYWPVAIRDSDGVESFSGNYWNGFFCPGERGE